MRALILYAILVVIGTVVAVFVGLFVESNITDAGSVAVFLALFFANFYVILDDHQSGGRAHLEAGRDGAVDVTDFRDRLVATRRALGLPNSVALENRNLVIDSAPLLS